MDELVGAMFVDERATCQVDADIELACVSTYVDADWWNPDAAACPNFTEFVVGLASSNGLGCGQPWDPAYLTTLEAWRCVSIVDGAAVDTVYLTDCFGDACSHTYGQFDPGGELLYFEWGASGMIPPVCCDSRVGWGGRSWGVVVGVDCSAALAYAPEDFPLCGGSGAP